MKPQLHTTSIDMYHRCGEQFRRRYLEGEKMPPGVAAVVGSGTDATVTKNLQSVIDGDGLMTVEEIKDLARTELEVAWGRGVWLNSDDAKIGQRKLKGQAIDKTVRLAKTHATDLAPKIKPTEVQRKWTVELKGYPVDLVGTIDIQEGKEVIRDTKTTKRTPNENAAENNTQMTTYALACKVLDGMAPYIYLDYLVDLKTPKVVSLNASPNDDDFKRLLLRIENMSIALEKGVFLPAEPGNFLCNPKWCGYHATCRYCQ